MKFDRKRLHGAYGKFADQLAKLAWVAAAAVVGGTLFKVRLGVTLAAVAIWCLFQAAAFVIRLL